MKSLNSIKNNFRSNEILSSKYSFKLKGGIDACADVIIPIITDPTTIELIGEPWDKRTPRPGTKK